MAPSRALHSHPEPGPTLGHISKLAELPEERDGNGDIENESKKKESESESKEWKTKVLEIILLFFFYKEANFSRPS